MAHSRNANDRARALDLFAQASALHRSGRLTDALHCYDAALRLDAQLADAHNNRGIALAQMGRLQDALDSYRRAIDLKPAHADALANQGVVLGQLGRFPEAIACFDEALAHHPGHALAAHYRAAAAASDAPVKLPDDVDSWLDLGVDRAGAGDVEGALRAFDHALAIDGGHASALGNRGVALLGLGRPDEALEALDRSIAIDPASSVLHFGRGNALRELQRPDEAVASYDEAIRLGANDAAVHYNRAKALADLSLYEEALAGYQAAACSRPGLAAAHYECAVMHWQVGDPAAAIASADRAIAIDPLQGKAFNLRGLAQVQLTRRDEALASFDRALELDPADANAHNNRCWLLHDMGRVEEAHASLSKALAINPELPFGEGQLIHLRMHLSEWNGHAERLQRLVEAISPERCDVLPLTLLSLIDDPALHRIAAANNLAQQFPRPAPALAPCPPSERIRIGYFSGDFFSHAIMHLFAEVLEVHDRNRFEIIALSYGPDTGDGWRERAVRACSRFIDVRERSDDEIAALARSMPIDIAVDLKGLTGSGRQGIFAARAAPLQLNYLGYPGSMPATFIDYMVADPVVVPPEERDAIAEKIIYLPDAYQSNCHIDGEVTSMMDRAKAELPADGFIFCCFNQNYKITPELFDVWMRIMRASGDSVLWLWVKHQAARNNLRREAEARGVAADRLIFADMVPREDHLARLRLADLFLDTRPYGAHTSASDALRVALPVLTCPGRSFASRVGASLLKAVRMPELICDTLDDYERRAIELAQSPETLGAIRAKLEANRTSAPLFDPQAFARHLEQAYAAILERCRQGLPPGDIRIERTAKRP